MNLAAGQAPFADKQIEYRDSMYASTREIGDVVGEWNAEAIAARGERIADWAVTRWPY
jgi:hypothetical protein